MLRSFFILICCIFLGATVNAQQIPFEEFKKKITDSWATGDYSKSIELLLKNKQKYAESSNQHTMIYYLGLLYLEVDDYQRSFDILNEGIEEGFFFSFWPNHLSKISQHSQGRDIILRNNENKDRYQKTNEGKYEVILPKNHNPKLKYPLLYFLHGNNSNLSYLRSRWQNVLLTRELIVVLAQSPYPRSNYTFDWIDSISSRKSLLSMHVDILNNYAVDSTKIIIGGFSNGGRAAIDIFMQQTLPVLGFVTFNPSKPKMKITSGSIGITSGRGVIITGEKDYMLKEQINMASTFFDLSFHLRLIVLSDHDHNYPNVFAEELDKSVEFLLEIKE